MKCNLPLNESIENFGVPGTWFIIQVFISSSVNGAPFLCFSAYQMKMFLNAFSLEQEPHIIVVMWDIPVGATCMY